MRMRDESPGGVPVAGGRQVPVGDPNERRFPLEFSLLRLGAGFLVAFLIPVLLGAAGAPGSFLPLVLVLDVASVGLGLLFAVRRAARYFQIPSFTEFNGLIVRQWNYEQNEVTYYCVAVDDWQRPTAWAFMVRRELYLALRPGMRVHVQMNERRNKPIRVDVTGPSDAVS
jgi:hypothetical protein